MRTRVLPSESNAQLRRSENQSAGANEISDHRRMVEIAQIQVTRPCPIDRLIRHKLPPPAIPKAENVCGEQRAKPPMRQEIQYPRTALRYAARRSACGARGFSMRNRHVVNLWKNNPMTDTRHCAPW